MITLKTFAEEITTLMNRQFDFAFNELMKSTIIGYRATILKQEIDKNGSFPRGSEDTICLPLIRVKPIECCASEDLDCYVARTASRVPSAIRANFLKEPFFFVGTSNMEKAFTYQRADVVKFAIDAAKFTQNSVYYDYFNGYIYTFNYEGGRLGVRDMFSNPLELLELNNCDGKPCLSEIYIDDDMKRAIKQMVFDEYKVTKTIPDEQQIRLDESSI